MAKKHKNQKKKIEGYVAVDARGNLLTATVRPTKVETEEMLHRFNPPVDRFSYPYRILPVTLDTDQIAQHRFLFGDED